MESLDDLIGTTLTGVKVINQSPDDPTLLQLTFSNGKLLDFHSPNYEVDGVWYELRDSYELQNSKVVKCL